MRFSKYWNFTSATYTDDGKKRNYDDDDLSYDIRDNYDDIRDNYCDICNNYDAT